MLINHDPFIALVSDNVVPDSIIEGMKSIPNSDFNPSTQISPVGENKIMSHRNSFTYVADNKFTPATEIILNFLLEKYNHVYEVDKAESWQLTRYETNQYFRPHCDYFTTAEQIKKRKTNRVATVILYLNDDFTGGETKFPNLGITIKPQRGAFLYFTYPECSSTNRLTLHSGETVTNGIKKIATLWLH
jgi:prolyl 4-hydroxylase